MITLKAGEDGMMGDRDIIIKITADNDDDVIVGMNACIAAITKLSDLLARHAEALEEREVGIDRPAM